MNLTPWSKRIAIVCLTAVVFVCVICRVDMLAGTALGGLLLLINPKE